MKSLNAATEGFVRLISRGLFCYPEHVIDPAACMTTANGLLATISCCLSADHGFNTRHTMSETLDAIEMPLIATAANHLKEL
jgi:hypothetical protein